MLAQDSSHNAIKTSNIIGISKDNIQEIIKENKAQSFRAQQLWHWLYNKGIKSFTEISNLNKELILHLQENYTILRPKIVTEQRSKDGTIKWLLELADKNQIETVFIPEEKRGTLCISSQVGCSLTCSFCHTGTQKMVRNLLAGEIIGQIMLAKDVLNDWPANKENKRITNIVLMGMGEPLINYYNVVKAVNIMTAPDGLNLSKRRVTLSTSGVVPNIVRFGEDTGISLAVSLHATNDELRNTLVPINRKYPIKELIAACKAYPKHDKHRRITFEYVMLKDINDSDQNAHELINLVKDLHAKINLIPFNPWPGSNYLCSDLERIKRFSKIIYDADIEAPVRTPRGQDILAACGQLKSASVKNVTKEI